MKSDSRISVVLPVLAPTAFLRAMTEFAIKTLRLHADNDFELIVVEAEQDYFNPLKGDDEHDNLILSGDDVYLNFNPKIGGVRELNAGVDAASGEFVVST